MASHSPSAGMLWVPRAVGHTSSGQGVFARCAHGSLDLVETLLQGEGVIAGPGAVGSVSTVP